MEDLDDLIDTIYEAGALPELWGNALDVVSARVEAVGGNLIVSAPQALAITSSPKIAEITRDFDAAGWNAHNTRVGRLLERAEHPGFLTDADLHTPEELRSLPMYTQFLTPRGADAGAATVIMGAHHDGIVVAFEAFEDHGAAHKAVPLLNHLRPHFARAAVVSGRIQSAKANTLADAFNAISVPVAILDRKGKILAASDGFQESMGDAIIDGPVRMRLADGDGDMALATALQRVAIEGAGTSLALRDRNNVGTAVLHLVPARRHARDLFNNIASFAILARPDNDALPSVDIIGALFDLTPAEARIARGIALGLSPAELAQELEVTQQTVRSHLKRVFSKTATSRQSELALLVSGFR